jgi:hypothetical protein
VLSDRFQRDGSRPAFTTWDLNTRKLFRKKIVDVLFMPDCFPSDRRSILSTNVVDVVIEYFALLLVNERLEAMKRKFEFYECAFCIANLSDDDPRLPDNKFYFIGCFKRWSRNMIGCNGTCIPHEFNVIKLI